MASASIRLFEALDAIAAEPGGVMVTDLARRLGVSKATASRLLASLVEAGFVTKADAQRHVLGFQLWLWGVQASGSARRIAEITRPAAVYAASVSDVLIATAILHGKHAAFLEVLIPSNGNTVVIEGQSTIPAYACAPGKVMLAYASPGRQKKALEGKLQTYTDATLTSPEELQREFALIRENGYALNRGEYRSDTFGIAVPIFDVTGEAVASISSSGSGANWDVERLESLLPMLRSISDSASAALGYSQTANMVG